MNFNQLTLVGFIGRDSETKTLKSGRQVTKFSVATKESWKAANGEWQEATEWCQVVGYGEGFAKLADRLLKGKHVLVQGRLHTDSYDREVEATHKNKSIKSPSSKPLSNVSPIPSAFSIAKPRTTNKLLKSRRYPRRGSRPF